MESILKDHIHYLSTEEIASVKYLLAYSWFYCIWETSQVSLHASQRAYELFKEIYSQDKTEYEAIAAMTDVASGLVGLSALNSQITIGDQNEIPYIRTLNVTRYRN